MAVQDFVDANWIPDSESIDSGCVFNQRFVDKRGAMKRVLEVLRSQRFVLVDDLRKSLSRTISIAYDFKLHIPFNNFALLSIYDTLLIMAELNCRTLREALLLHEVHEGDDEEDRTEKIDEIKKVAETLLKIDGKLLSMHADIAANLSRFIVFN